MEKLIAKIGNGAILSQNLSPNKQLIAIVTSGCIDIYDSESLAKVIRLSTNSKILSVKFSPNNKYLGYSTTDNLLFLHDFTKNETAELPIYDEDKNLKFVDQQTHNLYMVSLELASLTAITFTTDEENIIVGLLTNFVKYQNLFSKMTLDEAKDFKEKIPRYSIAVLNIEERKIKQAVNLERSEWDGLISISVSENSKYLAAIVSTLSSCKGPIVWNLETGKIICEFNNPDYFLGEVFFKENDKLVITEGAMFYFVNDLSSGKMVGKYLFGPFENFPQSVVEIMDDGAERSNKEEKVCSKLSGYSDLISILAFTPDNKFISFVGYKPTITLWDIYKGTNIKSFNYAAKNNYGFRCVNFSPDGKYLVAVSTLKTVLVWNTDTEEMIYHRYTDNVAYTPSGRCVSENDKEVAVFSPDGKYLAMGGGDLVIVEFLETGAVEDFIDIPFKLYSEHFSDLDWEDDLLSEHKLYQLCFSPNGRYIAQAYHGVLFVYDLDDNGKAILVQRFTKQNFLSKEIEVDDIYYLKFLPENYRILVITKSGEYLVNLNGEKEELNLKLHKLSPYGREEKNPSGNICLSTDGKLLANSNWQGEILVIDFPSGNIRKKIEGFQETINDIIFADDGSLIAAGGEEGIIKIWKLENR